MSKNNYQQPKAKIINLPGDVMQVAYTSKEEDPGSLDLKFEEEGETTKEE